MIFRRHPNGWPVDQLAPEDVTMEQLRAEVMRARTKFPGSRFLLTALMEEVGEGADEAIESIGRSDQPSMSAFVKSLGSWRKEFIQVACVAIRLAEEGETAYDNARHPSRTLRLIALVGRLCRYSLQKADTTRVLEEIYKVAAEINQYGDKIYDAVTAEEAKP